jgi:hypothetical protein
MGTATLALVSNTGHNARGYSIRPMDRFTDRFTGPFRAELAAGDVDPDHPTNAVESNRVTESTTTSLHKHHPVHIKEVGR